MRKKRNTHTQTKTTEGLGELRPETARERSRPPWERAKRKERKETKKVLKRPHPPRLIFIFSSMVAENAVPLDGATRGPGEVIVGYALTEKKCRSLFSPELIGHAR